MTFLRRLRGMALSAAVWAVIFAAVGLARIPIYAMLGSLYPAGPQGLWGVVQAWLSEALSPAWRAEHCSEPS